MKIKWRGKLSLALRTDFWRNWEKTFNLRHSISKWYRYLSQILLIPITNTYQNPNFNLFVFSILAEADNVLISEVSFSGMIHYVMLGLRWMSYHLNFGFSGSRVHFPSMSCRCWVTTYSHCHCWFSRHARIAHDSCASQDERLQNSSGLLSMSRTFLSNTMPGFVCDKCLLTFHSPLKVFRLLGKRVSFMVSQPFSQASLTAWLLDI